MLGTFIVHLAIRSLHMLSVGRHCGKQRSPMLRLCSTTDFKEQTRTFLDSCFSVRTPEHLGKNRKMVSSVFVVLSTFPQHNCVCSTLTQKPAAVTPVWQYTNKESAGTDTHTHISCLMDWDKILWWLVCWFSGSWVRLVLKETPTNGCLWLHPLWRELSDC